MCFNLEDIERGVESNKLNDISDILDKGRVLFNHPCALDPVKGQQGICIEQISMSGREEIEDVEKSF